MHVIATTKKRLLPNPCIAPTLQIMPGLWLIFRYAMGVLNITPGCVRPCGTLALVLLLPCSTELAALAPTSTLFLPEAVMDFERLPVRSFDRSDYVFRGE